MSASSSSMGGHPAAAAGRLILAGAATGIGGFIAGKGGDPEDVFAAVDLDPGLLGNNRSCLDLAVYVALLERAALATRHDNFGLVYGQGFKPEMLGLIGEIVLASATLGSALEHLATWFPWHQQATETTLTRWNGRWKLSYRILDGSIVERRQDAELTMGMFLNAIRACLGGRWTPALVLFEHPKPAHWAQHETLFNTEVYWSQSTNALVFEAPFETPMPGADRARLARRIEELRGLTGSRGAPTLANQLRGELRPMLASGEVHIAAFAERLGMHRWTLQRRLSEIGFSFSEILEQTRRDLARYYVAQNQLSLTEIGYLLGYSEMSAFSRAFLKWYGVSPRAFRALNARPARPR